MSKDKDFSFKVTEHMLDLSESKSGWIKQMNKVSWNGATPVVDIRSWHYPEGEDTPDKMGKGITISPIELKALAEFLKSYDFDEIELPF